MAHHLDDPLLDRAFDDLSTFECQFDADHFLLYVHDAEMGWQPTRRFPLALLRAPAAVVLRLLGRRGTWHRSRNSRPE